MRCQASGQLQMLEEYTCQSDRVILEKIFFLQTRRKRRTRNLTHSVRALTLMRKYGVDASSDGTGQSF